MLHTLPCLLSLHSAMLCTGHVYSLGTASNHIPAATAWHWQDEASPLVPRALSPFAHLHEGFLALPGSMQRGKGGQQGTSFSSTMQWGGHSVGTRLLQPTREERFIKGQRLIIYLAPPETAGCSTSSAHL